MTDFLMRAFESSDGNTTGNIVLLVAATLTVAGTSISIRNATRTDDNNSEYITQAIAVATSVLLLLYIMLKLYSNYKKFNLQVYTQNLIAERNRNTDRLVKASGGLSNPAPSAAQPGAVITGYDTTTGLPIYA